MSSGEARGVSLDQYSVSLTFTSCQRSSARNTDLEPLDQDLQLGQ
jgi:hypothetical protein